MDAELHDLAELAAILAATAQAIGTTLDRTPSKKPRTRKKWRDEMADLSCYLASEAQQLAELVASACRPSPALTELVGRQMLPRRTSLVLLTHQLVTMRRPLRAASRGACLPRAGLDLSADSMEMGLRLVLGPQDEEAAQ